MPTVTRLRKLNLKPFFEPQRNAAASGKDRQMTNALKNAMTYDNMWLAQMTHGQAMKITAAVPDTYAYMLGDAEMGAKDSEKTTAAAIKELASQTLSDLIDEGNVNTPTGRAVREMRERILNRIWSAFSVELVEMADVAELTQIAGDTSMASRLKAMPLAVLEALKKDR
jgi:hypothetical protein